VEVAASLASIAGAITLGAISPGPSFLVVARAAVARSRFDALAAALGMGVGGVLFALAALLGLHVVLIAVPWLYLVLKLAGGAYLIYIGYAMWRGARKPVHLDDAANGHPRTFWLGLLTQVSNPKTAVVYASVFAALLPPDIPFAAALIVPAMIFAIEAGWYTIVALALSAPTPRAGYLRCKTWIDRAAGAVMALLGVRLMLASK
jgi:threonine/homoserine/homoserine lactone efflux protein